MNTYHLRLTTDKSLDIIEQFVTPISEKYIISHEVTHYHVYLETTQIRKDLRVLINQQLQLKGNGQFSIADARDPKQLKKYVLKDGYYIYKNFTKQEIAQLRKLSTKKDKTQYSIELQELEDTFILSPHMAAEDFLTRVIQLQVTYSMKPRRTTLAPYIQYCIIKKTPHKAKSLARQILENII